MRLLAGHCFTYVSLYIRKILFLLFLFSWLNQVKAQSANLSIEDIRFESQGVTLAGTIYLPIHSNAAVVLVHGSDQPPPYE